MIDAAGSCSCVGRNNVMPRTPNGERPGNRVKDMIKNDYNFYVAKKRAEKYDEIMSKPKEERTLAEKAFAADYKASMVLSKIKDAIPEPQVKYSA